MAQPYSAKRMMIIKRCRRLHELKEQAQALIERVHRIITGISFSLGSRFGLDEVTLPNTIGLFEALSPCREDSLHVLLEHLQDKCRLRLGMLLKDLGPSLSELEGQLKAMDLDTVQNQLEGEDIPADLMDADALKRTMHGLDSHLATLHEYRVKFKETIEEAGQWVAENRAEIMDEIDEAKRNGLTFENLEDLVTFGENHLRELLEGRDTYDFDKNLQHFDYIAAGALPFMGWPVFETLRMLDECIVMAEIPTVEEESVIEVMEGDVMLY